jgi:hypothetical protein
MPAGRLRRLVEEMRLAAGRRPMIRAIAARSSSRSLGRGSARQAAGATGSAVLGVAGASSRGLEICRAARRRWCQPASATVTSSRTPNSPPWAWLGVQRGSWLRNELLSPAMIPAKVSATILPPTGPTDVAEADHHVAAERGDLRGGLTRSKAGLRLRRSARDRGDRCGSSAQPRQTPLAGGGSPAPSLIDAVSPDRSRAVHWRGG